MIRALRYSRDQDRLETLGVDQLAAATAGNGDPVWVDLALPSAAEVDLLTDCFHFHPLAVSDCFNKRHLPKVEQYGQTVFLIVHGPDTSAPDQRVGSRMLAAFLRGPLLVTVRLTAMVWVGEMQEQARRNPREVFRAGVAHIFCVVFDRMIEHYQALVDQMSDGVDALEEEVLTEPAPDVLQRVHAARQNLLRLRRLISLERDMTAKVARGDFPQLSEQERYYFRNIYDHLNHIHEELDLQRDSLTGVRDGYLSVLSNRMNELSLETNRVMKVLTMLSMALLPMTLVAGIFGMNFTHLPWLDEPWGGALGITLTLLPGVAVGIFYWWAGWLGEGRKQGAKPTGTAPDGKSDPASAPQTTPE